MVQEGNLATLLRMDEEKHVPAKRLTKDFPPTYVTHGSADIWAGVEQSRSLVEKMRAVGVEHVYDEIDGADHEFDDSETSEMKGMYDFLLSHW
ncbi:hypothetical protein BT69DRAFT_1325865 [Atractiella rhizophila]|nr:hypothetical protein BT69DRAFT_1325865 [Atractiella rhizophila]